MMGAQNLNRGESRKENPMKPILLSMLASSLLLSAALAGETGPTSIAPGGGVHAAGLLPAVAADKAGPLEPVQMDLKVPAAAPEAVRLDLETWWRAEHKELRAQIDTARTRQQQTFEACANNLYHWYPGWSSEGPFFGSCMGSVVSDGNRIYAVTALDGAACFDLDGHRLWVADLEGKQMQYYPASAPNNHNNMASPILAGGKLIYYHYGAVEFIALDAQTGRLAWRTPGPLKAGKPGYFRVAGTPIGYEGGHMTPGGTPVVMVLGGTPVVVSGHGMVCRIADGKFLGQVGFPADLAKKLKSDDPDTAVNAPEKGLVYASDYPSWVAQGDTLYAVALGRLIAVRLGLKADTLTQEVAWNVDAVCTGMGNGSNPVILGQTLYLPQGKGVIVKALDAATGKILASSSGPGVAGYVTNLAFARDLAVWKGGRLDQSMSSIDKDKGVVTYTVVGVPDLKPKGNGYLWPEKPTGEIAERHIAAVGTPRLTLSNSGVACWGNRIFIRDNDYIWCIGDRGKPFVPPEKVKP